MDVMKKASVPMAYVRTLRMIVALEVIIRLPCKDRGLQPTNYVHKVTVYIE